MQVQIVLSSGYPARPQDPEARPPEEWIRRGGPQAARGGRATAPCRGGRAGDGPIRGPGRAGARRARALGRPRRDAADGGGRPKPARARRAAPRRARRARMPLRARALRQRLGARSPRPGRARSSGTTAPPRTTSSASPAWSRCPPRPAATSSRSVGRSPRPARRHDRLVTATGRFARFAREGLEQAGPALGLGILACFSFRDPLPPSPPGRMPSWPVGRSGPMLCSSARWPRLVPSTLRGGVSPGLAAFPALLGGDPEDLLAPVQWHPETRTSPELGPSSVELVADARASALGELDYVAAHGDAAALIAGRCLELGPDRPTARAWTPRLFRSATRVREASAPRRGSATSSATGSRSGGSARG